MTQRGKVEYEFDLKGNLLNIIENKNVDMISIVSKNGKNKISKSFEYGTILNASNLTLKDGKKEKFDATVLKISSNDSRKEIFQFLANNTKVEWNRRI